MCQRVVPHPTRGVAASCRPDHSPDTRERAGLDVRFHFGPLPGGSGARATQAAPPRGYGLSREIDFVSITPCPKELEHLGKTVLTSPNG